MIIAGREVPQPTETALASVRGEPAYRARPLERHIPAQHQWPAVAYAIRPQVDHLEAIAWPRRGHRSGYFVRWPRLDGWVLRRRVSIIVWAAAS
jgi:hypothetical protein